MIISLRPLRQAVIYGLIGLVVGAFASFILGISLASAVDGGLGEFASTLPVLGWIPGIESWPGVGLLLLPAAMLAVAAGGFTFLSTSIAQRMVNRSLPLICPEPGRHGFKHPIRRGIRVFSPHLGVMYGGYGSPDDEYVDDD